MRDPSTVINNSTETYFINTNTHHTQLTISKLQTDVINIPPTKINMPHKSVN